MIPKQITYLLICFRSYYAINPRCQWTHFTLQKRERKNRKGFFISKWLL